MNSSYQENNFINKHNGRIKQSSNRCWQQHDALFWLFHST